MGWKSRTFSCIAILTASATAHPMGDNSVNQYMLLRVAADGVHLGYRLDFAENPTAIQMRSLDADSDGTVSEKEKAAYLADRTGEWVSRLTTTVDGKEVAPTATAMDLKVAEGGKTLLVMIDVLVPLPTGGGARRVSVGTGNYAGVPGWREAAAVAGEGFWIVDVDKRVKAKVIEQRGEPGDGAGDWVVAISFDRSGPTTRAAH